MRQQTEMIFAAIRNDMQETGDFSVDDISAYLWDNNGLDISPEKVMRAIGTLRKQGNDIVATGRTGWYRLVATAAQRVR